MRMVKEWRRAWRMISMQCMAGAVALQATWENLPDDMRMNMPSGIVTGITVFILIFGMIGRLIDQPKVREGCKHD